MKKRTVGLLLAVMYINICFPLNVFAVNMNIGAERIITFDSKLPAAYHSESVNINPEVDSAYGLIYAEPISASCEQTGNTGYWINRDSETLFSDPDGINEITFDDIVIAPAGHSLTLYPAAEVSCEIEGSLAYYVCAVCGKWFEDGTGSVEITDHDSLVIPPTGHLWGEWILSEQERWERVCVNDPSHFEIREITVPGGEPISGDVNGNGTVDMEDVSCLIEYLSFSDTAVAAPALDTNGDGIIDTRDLTHLLKLLSDFSADE